jgi:hypothetical protein
MVRKLLSQKVEKKLRVELKKLWYSDNPVYRIDDIAETLQFGVKGSAYENLRVRHVHYYKHKFGLFSRGRFIFSKHYQAKKASKAAHKRKSVFESEEKVDKLKRAKDWENFDGSWTEFVKVETVEKGINIAKEMNQ